MARQTVKIKSYTDVNNEYAANAAITPGMLIELMSTGKVRAHATAEGNVINLFALEDNMRGRDILTAFAANEPVQCWSPTPGDEVAAIIADGENIVIGDFLASNGDGP